MPTDQGLIYNRQGAAESKMAFWAVHFSVITQYCIDMD